MVNPSVRLVDAFNLRSNRLLALKKGINVATVNEDPMRQWAWLLIFAGATVRKGIVSAGELDTSDVFLQPLQTLTASLVQNFPMLMWKTSSVVLAFGLLEMQKAYRSAYHVVVGISLSRRTSLKKSPVSMVMTACQLVFKRRWYSWWIDCDTKTAPSSRTIAEGAGLTKIITTLNNSWKKAVEFRLNQVTLQNLCGQWQWIVPFSVKIWSQVFLIQWPTTWLVRTKLGSLRDWKSLWTNRRSKRRSPNEINSFAFALTGLVAEKRFPNGSSSSWFLLC